eukprot:6213081-Pyramimonas_sp.AAC.1
MFGQSWGRLSRTVLEPLWAGLVPAKGGCFGGLWRASWKARASSGLALRLSGDQPEAHFVNPPWWNCRVVLEAASCSPCSGRRTL